MSVTINSVNFNIQLTRGDSIKFTIRDKATQLPRVFEVGDVVKFTVKESVGGTQLFQKTVNPDLDGHIIINILAADTATSDFGKYVYDVEWTSGTDVQTIIPPSGRTKFIPTFEICEEVTNGGA